MDVGGHPSRVEPHLRARLALMAGGAAVVLAGSVMAWTSGTTTAGDHITRSGLNDNGKLTGALALLMLGCTVWFACTQRRRPAIASVVAACLLLVVSIYEWNVVADRVNQDNWAGGRWSDLTLGPGIYLLLVGSVMVVSGAVWTARMERT